MSIVYRVSDRIEIKVHDVTFKVSPLTRKQKIDVIQCTFNKESDSYTNLEEMIFRLVRYTVKEVTGGLEDVDGKKYELEMDGDVLSEDCVNDLLNLQIGKEIRLIGQQLAKGIPDMFTDPETGEKLDGVEIINKSKTRKK